MYIGYFKAKIFKFNIQKNTVFVYNILLLYFNYVTIDRTSTTFVYIDVSDD